MNMRLKTSPAGKIISPPPARIWTEEDFDLMEEYYALEARVSLWAFRQYMNPNLVKGHFPYEISRQLQLFYDRLIAGLRPKLVIEAPPQHGKSNGLHDFIGWVAGKRPDLKTIFASYSEDLGVTANMYLQRMYDDRSKYGRVFPDTMISQSNVVSAAAGSGRYLRNSSFLEYVAQKGSFRNVTVDGQVSGKGLDLGVIDDPIKGHAEARSKLVRDKTWNWLMSDFFSRFSDLAGLIITMTRWHVDDPVGRFLLEFPDTIVIKFPAMFIPPVKEKGETYRDYDPRRIKDEPLFPEFKSKPFLLERKKGYTQQAWASIYQQSPIISGGGMFPLDRVSYAKNMPTKEDIKKSVRYWDKAGTEAGGAYTCGVLMHQLHDGRWFISDVRRGQWSSWDREKHIKATAAMDEAQWGRIYNWVEQEPGSGGKESAERTIAMLAGYNVQADKVTGSKEVRAEPYAAQWQAGNIILHANVNWNGEFVDEHETFPNGAFLDQVDAAAGAFAKCIEKHYKYDSTLAWVG